MKKRRHNWAVTICLKIARRVYGTVTHVKTSTPVVALTFDDGPDPEFTPRLLAILKRYNAHATFFMIGEAATRNKVLVREVYQAGHAIGNHSWDHPCFPEIGRALRRKQIRDCEAALFPYGEKLFRPPKGLQTIFSRLDPVLLGYKVIAWNAHAYDWENRTVEEMSSLLVSSLESGNIILLHDAIWDPAHDSAGNRMKMLQALENFLDVTSGKYEYVTVPKLLEIGKPVRKHWVSRINQ